MPGKVKDPNRVIASATVIDQTTGMYRTSVMWFWDRGKYRAWRSIPGINNRTSCKRLDTDDPKRVALYVGEIITGVMADEMIFGD